MLKDGEDNMLYNENNESSEELSGLNFINILNECVKINNATEIFEKLQKFEVPTRFKENTKEKYDP